MGTSYLLNQKQTTSQLGNRQPLPIREILRSRTVKLSSPIEIKQINLIDSDDRYQSNDRQKFSIYQKLSSRFQEHKPNNDQECAAQDAWNKLEPQNTHSYPFYLFASRRGLPTHLFYQFVSEILQDKTVRNKGAIFVKKVMDYFSRSKL